MSADRGAVPPFGSSAAERAALARLYDLDLVDDPGDLDLYRALAARTGGPILELAVGTGRLAGPLADDGYAVTGVDIDPAMLERARGRSAAPRLVAEVVATLAAHLAPGGRAVVDVWLPDADDLARFDGRIVLEYPRRDPQGGQVVTKIGSAVHDAASATVRLTTIYEEGEPGAPAVRWLREDMLRLVGAYELAAFAELAGLEVETVAGGYGLEPLGPGDDRAVLVAAKPARPTKPARPPKPTGR